MAFSALDDRSRRPGTEDVASVLGRSHASWRALREAIAAAHEPVTEEWTFAGAKWGWSFRLKRSKRTILYMTPRRKHFTVGFVLGEKAAAAALASDLPAAVRRAVDEAPRYAEGRGLRLEIRKKADLDAVLALAAIKMAH
jgi:hypothetical protein